MTATMFSRSDPTVRLLTEAQALLRDLRIAALDIRVAAGEAREAAGELRRTAKKECETNGHNDSA